MQKLVGRKPFLPLRMRVSDGTMHEIRHREFIWVGTAMAVLVVPLPDQTDADKPLIERMIHIDLRHIVKVETEAAQATPYPRRIRRRYSLQFGMSGGSHGGYSVAMNRAG